MPQQDHALRPPQTLINACWAPQDNRHGRRSGQLELSESLQMFLQLACQTSSCVLTRCGAARPDRGLSCSHAGMLALRAQRDHATDRSGTRGRLFVYVAHNLRRPTSFSWFASDAYTARHECSCCLEGGTTAANSPVFDEYIEHCA